MAKKKGETIEKITRIAGDLAERMGYELVEAAFEKENTPGSS